MSFPVIKNPAVKAQTDWLHLRNDLLFDLCDKNGGLQSQSRMLLLSCSGLEYKMFFCSPLADAGVRLAITRFTLRLNHTDHLISGRFSISGAMGDRCYLLFP